MVFEQIGMLARALFPKEAWRTRPSCRGAPDTLVVVGVVVVRVPGVLGGTCPGGYTWYGSGSSPDSQIPLSGTVRQPNPTVRYCQTAKTHCRTTPTAKTHCRTTPTVKTTDFPVFRSKPLIFGFSASIGQDGVGLVKSPVGEKAFWPEIHEKL